MTEQPNKPNEIDSSALAMISGNVDYLQRPAAPPKPAPDAVREYATRLKEIGDWLVAKENVHDASALYSIARALSTPIQPTNRANEPIQDPRNQDWD